MYEQILVALDGSESSGYAGQAAVTIAAATSSKIIVCHVYGAEIHRRRFSEMEPGLPPKYHEKDTLTDLRKSHDRLMHEGFQALSTGYVEDFVARSQDAGITVESLAMGGRSYIGILHLAKTRGCDLIALGADGLGAIGDGMLGGTTSRVLHNASCDVLVARCALNKGPILTGVDGSLEALKAVSKAVALGRAMKRPVHFVAAYDPDFHTRVFGTMAQSLSPERQEEVGLAKQEKLHDDIINDGLGKLYTEFLHEAEHRFSTEDVTINTSLVTGKAYRTLDFQAKNSNSDLIVVYRHGNHHESCSNLGSNAEGLLRTTSVNVLLVGGVDERVSEPKTVSHIQETIISKSALAWDSDAENRLQRVPSFVRNMAKRVVENTVRELGKQRVSVDDFDSVAAQFGMGARGGDE
ncbi:MAG: universal stress protein [Planctomycetota bacterium]|jgi:nucleotide-binding universal stress UspA family protein